MRSSFNQYGALRMMHHRLLVVAFIATLGLRQCGVRTEYGWYLHHVNIAGKLVTTMCPDEKPCFWTKDWQSFAPNLFEAMERFVTSRSVVLDIGGWIGATSLWLALRARHVVVVEPSPLSFAHLTNNFQLNPMLARRVTLVHAALSSSDRKVFFTNLGSPEDQLVEIGKASRSDISKLCLSCMGTSVFSAAGDSQGSSFEHVTHALVQGDFRSSVLVLYNDTAVLGTKGSLPAAFTRIDPDHISADDAMVAVKALTVSTLFRLHSVLKQVDVVKMDIEGAEETVLPALVPFLKRRSEVVLILAIHIPKFTRQAVFHELLLSLQGFCVSFLDGTTFHENDLVGLQFFDLLAVWRRNATCPN